MKKLLWFFYGLAALLGLMLMLSLGLRHYWGRDEEKIEIRTAQKTLQAERDPQGVWSVKADSWPDLWFAMGYLQAWDREFQTELVRQAALGRLSSMLGAKLVARDRLSRMSARVARQEWERLAPDSRTRHAVEAYVEGRKAFLKNAGRQEPVEYRLLGLSRASLSEWQPWELLAISRFHAWQFSFDMDLEELSLALTREYGAAMASKLMAPKAPDAFALYAQTSTVNHVHHNLSFGKKKSSSEKVFQPNGKESDFEDFSAGGTQARLMPGLLPTDLEKGIAALKGASNLWGMADPRVGRAPTLCNDTHLRMSWPGPLYPFHFELHSEDKVWKGNGFLLPGLPVQVIGALEKSGAKAHQSIAWGITLASYVDTQDLVRLDPASIAKYPKITERFKVRDPETGQSSVQSFEEHWSPWGPVVSDLIDNYGQKSPQLALDWFGFRELSSTLEFFLNLNESLDDNVPSLLQRQWTFPAVNFAWMAKNQGVETTEWGHMVTGLAFSRNREHQPLGPLTPAELGQRTISHPQDRPYFLRRARDDEDLYFVTSNQGVWTNDHAMQTSSMWEDSRRARRVIENRAENVLKPEASQSDDYVPALADFYNAVRKEVRADELCGTVSLEELNDCLGLVADLDRWNGHADKDSWEATPLSLWFSLGKEGLMPLAYSRQDSAQRNLFVAWNRRNLSTRIFLDLLLNPTERKAWELASKKSLHEVLLSSFAQSYRTLVASLGPNPHNWIWGLRHRVSWFHPLASAPEPWGSLFSESLFGPAPPVSGGLDSPGRFDFAWDPLKPTEFPAHHAAVMRMCSELQKDGSLKVRWATATGPSGNPFSKWAHELADEFYFKSKLAPAN